MNFLRFWMREAPLRGRRWWRRHWWPARIRQIDQERAWWQTRVEQLEQSETEK